MSKILERIQKLLRLANNAGSEAEAALAAERARNLMAEHEIHEATLSLESPAEAKVDPIEQAFEVTTTKKKVAWHMRLAHGVAKNYGAFAFWRGGKIVMFGRLSAVQAANYTTHYLIREVDRITDREAPAARFSKAYRNAFRLGCANRIEQRLGERDQAANEPVPAPEPGDIATTVMPEVNPMALAVVEKNRKEVEDEFQRQVASKFGPAPKVGRVSSGGGYHAGKAAGDRANLGGQGRGLKAGTGSLK